MPKIDEEPFVLVEVDMVLAGDTNRTTYTLDEDGDLVRGISSSATEPMLFATMFEALEYMGRLPRQQMEEWRKNGLAEIRFVFD